MDAYVTESLKNENENANIIKTKYPEKLFRVMTERKKLKIIIEHRMNKISPSFFRVQVLGDRIFSPQQVISKNLSQFIFEAPIIDPGSYSLQVRLMFYNYPEMFTLETTVDSEFPKIKSLDKFIVNGDSNTRGLFKSLFRNNMGHKNIKCEWVHEGKKIEDRRISYICVFPYSDVSTNYEKDDPRPKELILTYEWYFPSDFYSLEDILKSSFEDVCKPHEKCRLKGPCNFDDNDNRRICTTKHADYTFISIGSHTPEWNETHNDKYLNKIFNHIQNYYSNLKFTFLTTNVANFHLIPKRFQRQYLIRNEYRMARNNDLLRNYVRKSIDQGYENIDLLDIFSTSQPIWEFSKDAPLELLISTPLLSDYIRANHRIFFSYEPENPSFQLGFLGIGKSTVSGTLHVRFPTSIEAKNISLTFIGREVVEFVDLSDLKKTRAEKIIVKESIYLWKTTSAIGHEPITDLDLPFEFKIPGDAFESLTSHHGKIQYTLKAAIGVAKKKSTYVKVLVPIRRWIIPEEQDLRPLVLKSNSRDRKVPLSWQAILPQTFVNVNSEIVIKLRLTSHNPELRIHKINSCLKTYMSYAVENRDDTNERKCHQKNKVHGKDIMMIPMGPDTIFETNVIVNIPNDVMPTCKTKYITVRNEIRIKIAFERSRHHVIIKRDVVVGRNLFDRFT
ncbi:7059_t:CDS:2 [Diversispora eburnea]|uniref:7059_t:CDS:1 n=1 Tax=Diversispora eburnea TaxID=1213867 RepID=A0A9N8YHT1_9GLOM|nr:7059_t:CDS:2 [Diversispora eburnea]